MGVSGSGPTSPADLSTGGQSRSGWVVAAGAHSARMALVPTPAAHPIYGAAARVRDLALARGTSLFDGVARVWTLPVLDDLAERLQGGGEIRGEAFDERWRRSLDSAPDAVLQLAGELLFVHVLIAADLTPATKRALVSGTLSLALTPARVPDWADAALESGLVGTGIAFKARRLSQLRFLVEAARSLRRARPARRAALLDDPWACKAWLHGLEHGGAQSQRGAVLHLLHPETFEPIVSDDVKRRIVAAFDENVPEDVGDVDEALIWIRRSLSARHGEGFAFVEPELAARWR